MYFPNSLALRLNLLVRNIFQNVFYSNYIFSNSILHLYYKRKQISSIWPYFVKSRRISWIKLYVVYIDYTVLAHVHDMYCEKAFILAFVNDKRLRELMFICNLLLLQGWYTPTPHDTSLPSRPLTKRLLPTPQQIFPL